MADNMSGKTVEIESKRVRQREFERDRLWERDTMRKRHYAKARL